MRQSFEDRPVLSAFRVLALIQTLFISYPIAFYCGHKLYLNWNEFFMKKRGTILILLTFIVAAWSPLIQNPYYSVLSLIAPHVTYYTSDHEWILYPSMWCRLLEISFTALRVYLLWFEQQHSDLVLSEGWRVLMDPEFGRNNWFYQKSTTFGDSKWMIKWIVLPSAFLWCALWGFAHYYVRYEKEAESTDIATVHMTFTALWLLINCVFGLEIWKKYSSFMDNLGIRQELKAILSVMALAVLCVVIVAALTFLHIPSLDNQWFDELSGIILMIIVAGAQMTVIWLMIVYPEKKRETMNRKPIPKLKRTSTNKKDRVNTLDLSTVCELEIKGWRDIVSEMEGFQSFCNFLQREFASENLLYIAEYMTIKEEVKMDKSMNEALNGKQLPFDVALPEKLQMSCIAREYRDDGTVQVALWELYHKYIDPSTANLEINVNWLLRSNIQSIFASHRKEDISTKMSTEEAANALVSLGEAAEVVAKLLNDAFLRFKRTEVYRELEDHLESKSASPVSPTLKAASSISEFMNERLNSIRRSSLKE